MSIISEELLSTLSIINFNNLYKCRYENIMYNIKSITQKPLLLSSCLRTCAENSINESYVINFFL